MLKINVVFLWFVAQIFLTFHHRVISLDDHPQSAGFRTGSNIALHLGVSSVPGLPPTIQVSRPGIETHGFGVHPF
jgi:hypothetical protein